MPSYPEMRMRRVRHSGAIRRMVQETSLAPDNFVYPMFVTHGRDVRREIGPMPGICQLSLDHLITEVSQANELGIPAVLLFGIPAKKDPMGKEAYEPAGIVQEAIRIVKETAPEMAVITDVCLCEYTDHGHCGVVSDGRVDNDLSLEKLAETAVCQAARARISWPPRR